MVAFTELHSDKAEKTFPFTEFHSDRIEGRFALTKFPSVKAERIVAFTEVHSVKAEWRDFEAGWCGGWGGSLFCSRTFKQERSAACGRTLLLRVHES